MEKTSIRQSNKGFTLVELCVTLVLFAVLATITTMGLLKWQEYSTNKEMEDKAEIIYMAVRNSIAKLKANNVLEETEGWGHSDSSTLGSDGKYHMVCTSGDYDDYINGTLSQTSAKLLFNMTADYLHDKKILNYISDKYIYSIEKLDNLALIE